MGKTCGAPATGIGGNIHIYMYYLEGMCMDKASGAPATVMGGYIRIYH